MMRPFLVGTYPLPLARPLIIGGNGTEPPAEEQPVSIPLMILAGTAVGAINGAVLLWQVSWAQQQPNVGKHVGRGAAFGAGIGALNGLLLGLLYQQQPPAAV